MNQPTRRLKNFIDTDNNRKKQAMRLVHVTAYTGHPWVHLEKYCRKYWRLPGQRLRGVDWLELSIYFHDEYVKSLGLPVYTQTELPSNLGDATTCE